MPSGKQAFPVCQSPWGTVSKSDVQFAVLRNQSGLTDAPAAPAALDRPQAQTGGAS